MFRVKILLSSLIYITISLIQVDCFSQTSLQELYLAQKYTEVYDQGLKQLKKSPKDVNVLKLTASSATELFLEKEGNDLFQKAIKLAPKDAEVYYLYGKHFGKFAKRKEEEIQFSKALELKSNYPEVYSQYSYSLFKNGKYQKADSISNLALQLNPKDSKAKLAKASSFAILGKSQEARQLYKELLSFDPKNREALLHFGKMEENLRNFTEAMNRYERILEFEPNDLETKIQIGVVYSKLNMKKEARTYFYKLLKENPNEVRLMRTVADFEMSMQNIIYAKSLYYDILKLDNKNPQSYINMYDMYAQLGLVDSSVIVLKKGNEVIPNSIELLMELGKYYGTNKKYAEAINLFKKAESLDSNNISCLFKLSVAYLKNGFTEEALTYANRIIALVPYDSSSFYYRLKAEIMLSKGDYLAAKKIFEKVVEINPNDAHGWYNLGIIYINKNDQENASKNLLKALELDPKFGECRKVYIRFLAGMSKFDEALKQCELLRDEDPFEADNYVTAIKEMMK